MNNNLRIFEYTDKLKGEIIYIVKAKDILEADLAINTDLGIQVEKLGHIGCCVIDID
jgi:hypothetical protein